MTVTLTPDLEAAVIEQARKTGKTTEDLVLEAVREKWAPVSQEAGSQASAGTNWEPCDDWERRLAALAVHTGVSRTDEVISRENVYEDYP